MTDCALTMRCSCGTYIRATQMYANQVVVIANNWINKHGSCPPSLTDENTTR